MRSRPNMTPFNVLPLELEVIKGQEVSLPRPRQELLSLIKRGDTAVQRELEVGEVIQ